MTDGTGDDSRKYQQLTVEIRSLIEGGTLKPGMPVPSIAQLTAEKQWSRGTCRHALQVLTDDGLLVRYPGLGYHVAP
jgi:DNA-binding GntR family transcriptional regulator